MLIASLRDVIRQQSGEIETLQKRLKEAGSSVTKVCIFHLDAVIFSILTNLSAVGIRARKTGFCATGRSGIL